MKRRQLLKTMGTLGVAGAFSAPLAQAAFGSSSSITPRTQSLLKDNLILDMTGANSPIHPVTRQPAGFETWIDKYKKAGVTWLSMTVSSDFTKSTGEMIHGLAANRRYLLQRPDEYVFVQTLDDVHRAKAEGKLGVNFNFQGCNTLEGDINLVGTLRKEVGAKVQVEVDVDPSLIGGLIVRVGSRMIDNSLRSKLQRLQLAMKGAG